MDKKTTEKCLMTKKYNKVGQEIISENPVKSYCNFYDMDM